MKLLSTPRLVAGLMLTGLSWQAAADCSAPAWSSTTTYQGGENVIFQGGEFKARYWINPGQQPNVSNPWDAWQFIQSCSNTSSSAPSSAAASSPRC